jgi:hypothetical protein
MHHLLLESSEAPDAAARIYKGSIKARARLFLQTFQLVVLNGRLKQRLYKARAWLFLVFVCSSKE